MLREGLLGSSLIRQNHKDKSEDILLYYVLYLIPLLRVQTAANLASQANCGASLLGGLPLQGIFSQQARDVLDGFPKRENVIQQVWE
eukprot:jgi/Tetstr1/442109/TSEL_030266.t1